MIISIDEARVVEAAQYTNSLRQIIEHRYNSSVEYEKMLNNFTKMVNHPDNRVLICTENNKILGVLAILVEPAEKYIEASYGGILAEENYQETARQFLKYLEEKYLGYQFDTIYPVENKEAICFMESIGARCHGIYMDMRLVKEDFHPLKYNKQIVPLSEKYYEAFSKLHDENHPDVYWTSKRILSALDKYNILLALENGEVAGSLVASALKGDKVFVDFLETAKPFRKQGYARSLLEKTAERAFNSGAVKLEIEVEVDNTPAVNLYKSFGFKGYKSSSTYSIYLCDSHLI